MRIIEVIADQGYLDTLTGVAEQHAVDDVWFGAPGEDGRGVVRMLVRDGSRQAVVDTLQGVLGSGKNYRIIIQPVEAVLPRADAAAAEGRPGISSGQTREELYSRIERGAQLDSNFLLLACLSTVVASIGLIEDNVAVVVGAMVIAPLLGPNLALSFGATLGDSKLIWRALRTSLAGVGLTLLLSVAVGLLWPEHLHSNEIMARTDVDMAGVTLALVSGAAAVLSLITGLSSTLVGVMVAVALLPPAATLGMMLGSGNFSNAAGAALLLAVNVVCVNLSAKFMFWYKGVRPRTWLEKTRARQSMLISTLFWFASLVIVIVAIVLRHRVVA